MNNTYGAGFVVRAVVGLIVAQCLLATLLLGLFHSPAPRDLPVAIVGSGPLVEGIAKQLAGTGVFSTRVVPDGATARGLIDERKIYGAYAPRAAAGRLLIATAASQPVTGVLQQTFAAVDAQRKVQTTVTDVKPLPKDDAGGAAGYLLVLALTVLSIAVAWMLELRVPSVREGLLAVGMRLGLLAGFGILSALALALVATAYGAFDGYFLELTGILALTSFAVTTVTSVATSLLGGPLGLVAPLTLFLLVGILAASGATSAPEFLPAFWRGFGSVLPPRSGIDAIRNTAYFGGEAIATPLIVLSAFSAVGAVLMLALVPVRNLTR
jgi:hypothetical protein